MSTTSRDDAVDCDNIESLTIAASPESTGVTTFVQEACESMDVLGKHYAPTTLAIVQPIYQDLKEYFRRPRMIGNGALPTATRGSVFSTNVTPLLIFSSYFPNGAVRLTGVWGVRYRLVYTLQVACTPFHQGVLALSWQYDHGQFHFLRGSTPQTSTNIPHVRLDLSVDTMVQLSVPFLWTYEFAPIDNGTFYGNVSTNTIMEIPTVVGLSAPTYKLYVHLEDLELIGALPQASVTTTLQSGKTMPMNSEFEQEAYPFSSGLSSLSRTVRWIARGVPSLSSIASPAAWFLAKAAGAVRSLGYSKPQIVEPIVRMVPNATASENNVDVSSATIMVGPFASNQVVVSSSFAGSDVDEMSLSYVLSQYSQICYGAMSTSNAASTVLYASSVSPSSMWFRAGTSAPYCNRGPLSSPTGSTNAFQPSSLFFWASMFRFWKGGFKYRVTFSKSKFHGGRVLLTYIPGIGLNDFTTAVTGTVQTAEALGGNTQPFGYTAICDLRDGNVFEFDVPYMTSLPFSRFLESIGSISMSVVDPLQAPGVVSSTINFLVEVKAASDFELATPVTPLYSSIPRNATIQIQSGKMLPAVNAEASLYTVGEATTSVKQLIMIPHCGARFDSLGGTTSNMLVYPWYYQPPIAATVPNPNPPPPYSFSFGGNAATCYLYVRGSTDLHVYSPPNSTSRVYAYANFAAKDFGEVPATAVGPKNTPSSNLPRVVALGPLGSHFRFPNYGRVQRMPSSVLNNVTWAAGTGGGTALTPFPNIQSGPVCAPKLWLFNSGTIDSTVTISRCAGDDAQLGHYMGPPPLYISSGVTSIYDPDGFNNY